VLDGGVEEFGAREIFVEAFDLVVPVLSFDAAEASQGPLGGDEHVDQCELVGIGGMEVELEGRGEGFELGGIFAGMIWDQASMPDLRALSLEAALPSGDLGPVDFWALRRFAFICASVGIVGPRV
jgi:hypothetical protein